MGRIFFFMLTCVASAARHHINCTDTTLRIICSCYYGQIRECGGLTCGRLIPASGISLKSKLTKYIIDNRTEQREAQGLASFTGERTSPYLFISSAPWPKYLAQCLLQKRTSKARPPYPRLILALLIKK